MFECTNREPLTDVHPVLFPFPFSFPFPVLSLSPSHHARTDRKRRCELVRLCRRDFRSLALGSSRVGRFLLRSPFLFIHFTLLYFTCLFACLLRWSNALLDRIRIGRCFVLFFFPLVLFPLVLSCSVLLLLLSSDFLISRLTHITQTVPTNRTRPRPLISSHLSSIFPLYPHYHHSILSIPTFISISFIYLPPSHTLPLFLSPPLYCLFTCLLALIALLAAPLGHACAHKMSDMSDYIVPLGSNLCISHIAHHRLRSGSISTLM